MDQDVESITGLLQRWRAGDTGVQDQLAAELYPFLRRLSQSHLGRYGPMTMRATELANEAYLQLARQQGIDWRNRDHFMAIAATVVRRVVIDYLRARSAQKRGTGALFVDVADLDGMEGSEGDPVDWLAVDQALRQFEADHPDIGKLVELRLFSDLSLPQIAKIQGVSTATVGRQWRFARAWLTSNFDSLPDDD